MVEEVNRNQSGKYNYGRDVEVEKNIDYPLLKGRLALYKSTRFQILTCVPEGSQKPALAQIVPE